ncbi:sigma-70 family RNA polymerase sigma factor [Fulvivirgaceae bacterium BMA12]|uniref:Sigma-70 family RNA polymerase sigma factor n=1 Tax=Agaribacillus aureus TaxID=3051825 RepID=A0ABT8LKC1_9BACT|nr:sigma-70 family RNA polymerase sigma factor [Fulvivirgaceae bacterium BMA12]
MGDKKGGYSSETAKDKSGGVLIEQLKAGDEKAYETLYAHYQHKLRAYAYAITQSDIMAEEMVQEVFIKLWVDKKNLQPDLNFDYYIFKVTRNLAFNHLKKTARNERLKREQLARIANNNFSTQDNLTFEEYQRIVWEIAKKLPAQKKAIYELFHQKGLSNEAIAVQLGISLKTVQNNQSEIIKTIKANLRRLAGVTLPLLPVMVIFG